MSIANRSRSLAGYIALAHPGPATACTALTLLAGWSAAHQQGHPPAGSGRRLALSGGAMFLAQISTGALNDYHDRRADAVRQPYKPISQQRVSVGGALAFALATGALSLAAAFASSLEALRWMAGGLASGWSYDLGLSQTPLSFLPFVTGIATVPRLGPAAIGMPLPRPWAATAIAGVLGFGLHLANGAPDSDADRLSGRRSLPVLLGEKRSRSGTRLALTAGTAMVVASTPRPGRRWALAGAASCLLLLSLDRLLALPSRLPGRHPFVLPVLAGGVLASGWLLGTAELSSTDRDRRLV